MTRAREARATMRASGNRYRGLNRPRPSDGFRRPLPRASPLPGDTTDHHAAVGYQGAQGERHRLAGSRTDPRRCPRYRLRAGRQRDLPRQARPHRHRPGHLPDRADHRRTALVDAKVHVRFATTDATRLDGYDDAFDTVVDSGCYHCLDEDGRAATPWRCTAPPARAPPCCSARSPTPTPRPATGPGRWCPRRQLRRTLGDAGWTITSLESHHRAARGRGSRRRHVDAAAQRADGA